jgi:hypothetical protein
MAKNRTYTVAPNSTGFSFPGAGCGALAVAVAGNPNVTSVPPPVGTAFTAGPGKTLTNIHVQLVFWGGWWDKNPIAAQVTNAVQRLLAGPYMTYLAQYGVRRGSLRRTTFVTDSEPGTFSYTSVAKLVTDLLDDDQLPEPDDDCDFVSGVKAQAYWSTLDGNGVLPKMYSVRRTLAGQNIGGKLPRPMPSANTWITSQF